MAQSPSRDVAPGAEDVLAFWLGSLDEHGLAAPEARARWFKKDPAFDEEIRERFGALHAALAGRRLESWLDEARPALAYVIVLDQFSRNMFRGTPGMYATDPQALEASRRILDTGFDHQLSAAGRGFVRMPFMHSEALADQDRCIELFRTLAEELGGPAGASVAENVKYAHMHRDIVARFGRFPHRNRILGRACTEEEEAFLKSPGSSF